MGKSCSILLQISPVLRCALPKGTKEEMLIDSDDEEEICVIAATSIFVRRDLNRNYGFCDVIVPTYSIDEFKSHFRMTRGTLDILC